MTDLFVSFQYSLFSKKESAHEDNIWSCDWGRREEREEEEEVEVEEEIEEEVTDQEEEEEGEKQDGEEDGGEEKGEKTKEKKKKIVKRMQIRTEKRSEKWKGREGKTESNFLLVSGLELFLLWTSSSPEDSMIWSKSGNTTMERSN